MLGDINMGAIMALAPKLMAGGADITFQEIAVLVPPQKIANLGTFSHNLWKSWKELNDKIKEELKLEKAATFVRLWPSGNAYITIALMVQANGKQLPYFTIEVTPENSALIAKLWAKNLELDMLLEEITKLFKDGRTAEDFA